MSATNPGITEARGDRAFDGRPTTTVLASTETKASFKTTEFLVFIGMLAAIFVAGAVTKAGAHHGDVFGATRVWLYATILSIGYLVSRGLAKSGSREHYREDR
jgi:hypothetical protein